MFSGPKILVCTDFSEGSDKALKVAKDLAHKTKGEIHLLHVAEISFYLNVCGYLPELNEQFLNTITDDIIKMLHEQAYRCGVAADVKVIVKNDVLSGVLEDLKELKADLVIVGSKGTSPELNFYFGSNARKICSVSPVPVLVVNDETRIERVGALVDADHHPEEVLKVAADISKTYHSHLTVISLLQQLPGLYSGNVLEYSSIVVNALRNEGELQLTRNKEKIQKLLGGTETNVIVKATFEKDLGYHLTEILNDEEIQLAVVKKHHKSLLERFVLGSVSARVLELYKGNVLVY